MLTAISILTIGEVITFLLASLLHAGVPIPLGFTQPQIMIAAIVEGLIGIFLLMSLYAVFAHKIWAWPSAT